eukprot:m51a1_g3867 hypothetical protein (268) ;mRNA; f:427501-428304
MNRHKTTKHRSRNSSQPLKWAEIPDNRQERMGLQQQSAEARAVALGSWGDLSSDVLAPIVNPAFLGGPCWPCLHQSWRVSRAGPNVLIASDGLSDPYDDEGPQDVNGLGLEVYAVASDSVPASFGDLPTSWLWSVVYNMSQFVARCGARVASLVRELGVISMEIDGIQGFPEEYQSKFVEPGSGRVGALLGLTEDGPQTGHVAFPAQVQGPLSPMLMVNIKLLTLDELLAIRAGGEAARNRIADALRTQGNTILSSLTRPSVHPSSP